MMESLILLVLAFLILLVARLHKRVKELEKKLP